jgi:hypothetical protein
LLEKINTLNKKLDVLMNSVPQQQETLASTKEVKVNAY